MQAKERARLGKEKTIKRININNIDDEIRYLCKLLKTSKPEQYIYTYIKEIFPSAIRGQKFEWLLWDSEFDIFIPDLKLAIEYDGKYWHTEKLGLSDIEKNKLAKEHNITLFRVREKGLDQVDCDSYLYNFNKTYSNINEPINAIIDFINIKYNKDIETLKDFNFDRGKIKIVENLRKQEIEQSLIGTWKEIEDYWDYDLNGIIKPEYVRPTHNYRLNAICPYCNKNVEFNPWLSAKYFGKYSFTPHICEELDKYCMSLLEKKCINCKIELSMENLDDRRLKDWLIRIARYRTIFTTIRDDNVLNRLEKKIGFEINRSNLWKMKIASYNDLFTHR